LDFAFGLVHGGPRRIDRGLLSQVFDRWNNPARNSFSYLRPTWDLPVHIETFELEIVHSRRHDWRFADLTGRVVRGDRKALDFSNDGSDPEAQVVINDEERRIDTCMEELEAGRAVAVKRAYVEGLSSQELADQFGVPLNTMRTWLRAAF
jgi:DNA-directed RNA polymerase specialized sigma24 family protein